MADSHPERMAEASYAEATCREKAGEVVSYHRGEKEAAAWASYYPGREVGQLHLSGVGSQLEVLQVLEFFSDSTLFCSEYAASL